MIDVGAVHYFQPGAIVEGDEPAGELFCRIMVNRVDNPSEVFPVEFTDFVDVFYPDGDMFDFHSFRTLRLATKAKGIGACPF